jgi:hypothetical protein
VTPEFDPERTEERFGHAEATARRDYNRQNGQKSSSLTNASQAVVAIPQGTATPTVLPPSSPDAGVDGAGPRKR